MQSTALDDYCVRMKKRERTAEMVDIKGLGPVVVGLRNELKLTRAELADKMNASASWLASVELESREQIYASFYRRLAEFFKLSVEELDARWKGDTRVISHRVPAALFNQVKKVGEAKGLSIDEMAEQAWRMWLGLSGGAGTVGGKDPGPAKELPSNRNNRLLGLGSTRARAPKGAKK